MPEEKPSVSPAEAPGRRDELQVPELEHGAPADPRVDGDGHDADGQEGVPQARPDHGHDRNGQERAREREQDVHAEHEDQIGPSSDVPRHQPETRAEACRHRHRADPEPERYPRAVQDADQDVPPQRIRPERVLPARGSQPRAEVGIGPRVVAMDRRRHDRHQQEAAHHRQPRARHRAPDEPAPGGRGGALARSGGEDHRLDGGGDARGGAHQSYLIRGSTAAYRRSVSMLTTTTMTAMNRLAPCTIA